MRIFTFSGINGGFVGQNDGVELKYLARDFTTALSNLPLTYKGKDNEDHFRSSINWTTLLSQVGLATVLDGSPVLNEEADRLSQVIGPKLVSKQPTDPVEPILILAHSQGTNVATFTLLWLLNNNPEFFKKRSVRCLFLDPKVGPNNVEEVFNRTGDLDLPFLFLQSEKDLLSRQGVLGTRFISQFHLGNHLFVSGLGHSDIVHWELLKDPKLRWLTRDGYHNKYLRDVQKERVRISKERSRPGWTTSDSLRLERYMKKYPMNQESLIPGLLSFAKGSLLKRFSS
ncbi:MAG: hypothetical protein H0X66_07850 [Verrucomicrobia bacterium]|nr:hypothetical protein [Verrucomicrobiota bacterium]